MGKRRFEDRVILVESLYFLWKVDFDFEFFFWSLWEFYELGSFVFFFLSIEFLLVIFIWFSCEVISDKIVGLEK